jgi:amino acid adenylation domain-containing protein
MLVSGFLERSAASAPEKTAVVFDGRRYSYASVDRAANRLGHLLRANGVIRGDRVVIQLDNGVTAVAAVFGTSKASATFVPISPQTPGERLAYLLNDCQASALITTAQGAAALFATAAELPHLRVLMVIDSDQEGCVGGIRIVAATRATLFEDEMRCRSIDSDTRPPQQNIDIDLAAVMYTSGSTGRPKGVMLTHLNMRTVSASIVQYLANTADDVILNVLPMSHGYGLYQALTACRVGATLVIERSFAYPHVVLAAMERERATGFALVPTIAGTMARVDLRKYDLSSLRYITSAAAALPVERIRRLRAALPHVALFSMYGLTECQRVSFLSPDEIDARPDSVGKGMPNEEVYIADEHGRPVGPGVVGELVVRGAHVMHGYWNLPDETARRLRPGSLPHQRLLYTGDLFRMDEEGYLYFVARSDDMIKTGGEKVSPNEVENLVYQLDAVEEVAVVGVPHDTLGQAVRAIVALKAGASLTTAQVRGHCARFLEPWMVPSVVHFVSALPHTASGKIDKRALGLLLTAA